MANIVFVDKDDNIIGAGTGQEAVERGIIHRVARIFLYNSKGEALIQRRSDRARSYPSRWDNSAAGHVDEGEEYEVAAYRELMEEIGVTNIKLLPLGKFYTEDDDVGNIKKRFSMCYEGVYDGEFKVDPKELAEIKWIEPQELLARVEREPNAFTPGAAESFRKFLRK